MGAYLLKRFLLIIPTLFGIMVINFVLTQFVPGGPIEQVIAELEGGGDVFEGIAGTGGGEIEQGASDDGYAGARGLPQSFLDELRVQYNFARLVCAPGHEGAPAFDAPECEAVDIPAFERFWLMIWDYVRFDFGESFRHPGTSVVDLVLDKMPVSITLGLWSTLIAYLISIPLGIRKAVRDGSRFDTWTSGLIIVGYAIPGFLFAILLLVLFAGGSYYQAYPLRGLTSDYFDVLSPLGRVQLYLPFILLVLAGAWLGALAARRAGSGRAGPGLAVLAGGAAGLVLAALAARGLAGDLLGGEGQHLWIVAAPAAAGTLWAAWAARRGAEGAGAILLRMALGAGLGLVLIGLLSVAGLVRAVPPGAPRPDGPTTLFGQLGDYFWHITLPVAASTIASFATLTLLTKNSFLDEIRKQYVMTAKAKGLSEGRVLYGHVFRNAMLIVIAGFPGLFIAVFFGGSIIIETIFSLDGLGRLGFEAAVARNYPVIFGTLFFFGLVGLVVGILSDLMYVLVDPRIDFEARRT